MAGHKVIGAAVVLRVRGGGERYLYRGSPVPENVYLAESVKHAVSVGLLAEVPDEKPEEDDKAASTAGTDGSAKEEPKGSASKK